MNNNYKNAFRTKLDKYLNIIIFSCNLLYQIDTIDSDK